MSTDLTAVNLHRRHAGTTHEDTPAPAIATMPDDHIDREMEMLEATLHTLPPDSDDPPIDQSAEYEPVEAILLAEEQGREAHAPLSTICTSG